MEGSYELRSSEALLTQSSSSPLTSLPGVLYLTALLSTVCSSMFAHLRAMCAPLVLVMSAFVVMLGGVDARPGAVAGGNGNHYGWKTCTKTAFRTTTLTDTATWTTTATFTAFKHTVESLTVTDVSTRTVTTTDSRTVTAAALQRRGLPTSTASSKRPTPIAPPPATTTKNDDNDCKTTVTQTAVTTEIMTTTKVVTKTAVTTAIITDVTTQTESATATVTEATTTTTTTTPLAPTPNCLALGQPCDIGDPGSCCSQTCGDLSGAGQFKCI